ncbi:MAG: phosphatidic acid phosphatase [Saprospiraceae bacterium]|nr:phosphatidic acid phosphatase [Saprospiraceae bacterium]
MRAAAHIVSFLFHPLLMMSYGLVLLLCVYPHGFSVHSLWGADRLLIICFIYTFFFPSLAILMMRGLGMISSLEMPTRQERWGPLIICLVLYFWFFANIRKNPAVDESFTAFVLGASIALSLSFLASLFDKISLHGVGAGGLVGLVFVLILLNTNTPMLAIGNIRVHLFIILVAFVLLAGIIGSSRLYLKAHSFRQVVAGVLVGFSGQMLATGFLY